MLDNLEAITIEPATRANSLVIWLHGLGADGHDFESVIPALGLPSDHAVRFVFPHAPVQPVTVNGGMKMRAWYDIREADLLRTEDEIGIRQSAMWLSQQVQLAIENGIAAQNIIVAGFSQGGAIALHAGLRLEQTIAGILALSTYLPLADSLADELTEPARSTPVFMAHGIQDPVVPLASAEQSMEKLKQQCHAVDWRVYPMGHNVIAEEIQDIGRWLNQCLATST